MTEQDVRILVGALIPAVREGVERLLVQERTATDVRMVAVEARLERLGLVEAAIADLGKETIVLRERTATLEARPLPIGPPGPPGPPGRDGVDGKAGLTYCGVYVEGRTYELGDGVTYAGSFWHCNAAATTTKPGDGSPDWTLMVKRGRDGRDRA